MTRAPKLDTTFADDWNTNTLRRDNYKLANLITIELTHDEQISLLGLIVNSTNGIIAAGDPNKWLPDLESVEEKIRSAQDNAAVEHAALPIIYDDRSA